MFPNIPHFNTLSHHAILSPRWIEGRPSPLASGGEHASTLVVKCCICGKLMTALNVNRLLIPNH